MDFILSNYTNLEDISSVFAVIYLYININTPQPISGENGINYYDIPRKAFNIKKSQKQVKSMNLRFLPFLLLKLVIVIAYSSMVRFRLLFIEILF